MSAKKAAPTRGSKSATTSNRAGGDKLRYMQTRLSDSSWRALKVLSIEQGKPLQGLVIDALNDLLRKHGKEPVVTGPDVDGTDK